MEDSKELGKRIKKIRKGLCLTQQEFVRRLGITRGHLSNIEKGQGTSKALLELIIVKYGLSWDSLASHPPGAPVIQLDFTGYEGLLEKLKASAKANVRSLDQEIIFTCKERK